MRRLLGRRFDVALLARCRRHAAAGGARRRRVPWRSALRADFAVLLGSGSRRGTRFARCASCAQTAAASLTGSARQRADLKPPLLAATERAAAAPRLPRHHRWERMEERLPLVTQRSFAPLPRHGRAAGGKRRAGLSGAASSAGEGSARAARFHSDSPRLSERRARSAQSELRGEIPLRAAQRSQRKALTATAGPPAASRRPRIHGDSSGCAGRTSVEHRTLDPEDLVQLRDWSSCTAGAPSFREDVARRAERRERRFVEAGEDQLLLARIGVDVADGEDARARWSRTSPCRRRICLRSRSSPHSAIGPSFGDRPKNTSSMSSGTRRVSAVERR